MVQDLERLCGGRHGYGLHPALLRNGGTGLTDRLLVVHDEKIHRDNFAADRCFFTHCRNHESLRLRLCLHLEFHFRNTEQTWSFTNTLVKILLAGKFHFGFQSRVAPPSRSDSGMDSVGGLPQAPSQAKRALQELLKEPPGLLS